MLSFLKIPMGARASAMGSYDGPALADPQAYFWNPARIAKVDGFQSQFSHSEYLGEFRHEGVATVFSVPKIGHLSLGFNGLFALPFEGARDIEENPNTHLKAMDYAAGAAWGGTLWEDRLLFGLKASWLHSQLDDVAGDGYAIDLGFSWPLPMGIWGSAVLQNLAHGFQYRSGTHTTEKLPSFLQLGLGYSDTTGAWAWQAGYSKSNDAFQRLHLGGEWNWRQTLFVRSGYEWDMQNSELGWARGIGAGLGLHFTTLGLEYSLRSLGDLGLIHTITFQVNPPNHYREAPDYLRLAKDAWERGTCQDAVRFANLALREDPSRLEAVAIVQACTKEGMVAKAQYVALAFSGNTEGQALTFFDNQQLNGGLARRKTLLDRLHMLYPGIKVIDAGRLFAKDSLANNSARIVELMRRMPVDLVLLSALDVPIVKKNKWGTSLPWISTGPLWGDEISSKPWSLLKFNKREVGVFAFSSQADKPLGVEAIGQEIQKVREAWGHSVAMQVLMWDGPYAMAETIANTIPGIDAIFLSGAQELLPRPVRVQKTWISCPGRRGEYMGLLLGWFEPDAEPRMEFRMIPIDETLRPDSVFAEELGEEWRMEAGENNQVIKSGEFEDYLYLQQLPDGRQDLWLASHATGKAARQTQQPAHIRSAQVAWSRKQFLFVADSADGRSSLYLQNLNEKRARMVGTDMTDIIKATYEPYENWIYFIRSSGPDQGDLWRMTWQGTHAMNLSRGTWGAVQDFAFSPNGRSLVLRSLQDGKSRIFNAGLTLAHREAISPDTVETYLPSFHPSGVQLAYLSHGMEIKDSLWDLVVWDARTDKSQVIVHSRPIHRYSWSQDGSKLMLEVGINRRNVVLVDLETGEEQPLRTSFEEVLEDRNPEPHRWQGKDGVLFESGPQGSETVLWAPLDGSNSAEPLVSSDYPTRLP